MSLKSCLRAGSLLFQRHAYRRMLVRYRKKTIAPEVMEKYLYPEVNPNISSKLNIISLQESDLIFITKYSSLGFTLHNEVKLSGPTIFFPRNVIKWKIFGAADIDEKSLRLFTMLTPKLDMLIIGTGGKRHQLSADTIKYLREHQVYFEVMPTDQAIATFNFQNNDQRWVAAALIPPEGQKSDISDYVQTYYSDLLDSSDYVYSEEKDLPQIEEKAKDKQVEGDDKDSGSVNVKKVTAKPNIWGGQSPLGMAAGILSDQTVTVDRDKHTVEKDTASTKGDVSQDRSEKSDRDTDSSKK